LLFTPLADLGLVRRLASRIEGRAFTSNAPTINISHKTLSKCTAKSKSTRRTDSPLRAVALSEPEAWRTSNTEHRTPNTEHRTPNIEHRTSNTEHRTSNTEHRTPNIEHRTPNTEHRTLNTEHTSPSRSALRAGGEHQTPTSLLPPSLKVRRVRESYDVTCLRQTTTAWQVSRRDKEVRGRLNFRLYL